MVAVPALIAVLPDLLHFARKATRKKKRKPATPPVEGSFQEYVLSQEGE